MENDRQYKFLLDKIMRNTNIDFSEYRPQLLKRRVRHRLHAAGCSNYWDYVALLNKDLREYDRLIETLTIKESCFFRNTKVFDILENEIIPEIVYQKQAEGARQIRAWSCGTAHGQEAYSMAILIREALGYRIEDFDIRILATDIDKDALEKDEAFSAGVKEARTRGFKEKEALMQQAMDEEKKIIAGINSKAQAELAEIRNKIKSEAEAARESLQKEVDNFADQICQKILGRAV